MSLITEGLQAPVKVAPGNSETIATRARKPEMMLGKKTLLKWEFPMFPPQFRTFPNSDFRPLGQTAAISAPSTSSRGERVYAVLAAH